MSMISEIDKKFVYCRDCIYWQDAEPGVVEMPICERLTAKHNYGHEGTTVYSVGNDMRFGARADDYCSFGRHRGDAPVRENIAWGGGMKSNGD